MFKRNFPLILLLIVFAALLDVVVSTHRFIPAPVETLMIAPEPEPVKSFTGRVVMPNLDDMYVLDNSAGRDLVQLEKFLQGRAAGLHYLASEHFKTIRKSHKKNKRAAKLPPNSDILVGIRLSLDSLGQFELKEFVFSNTEDQEFKNRLAEHIKYYWRYPRGTAGKLEFWIPIRWFAQY